jgi:hypothetical protein
MTPFETTLALIALAVVGVALLVVLGWFITTQSHGERAQNSRQRFLDGR